MLLRFLLVISVVAFANHTYGWSLRWHGQIAISSIEDLSENQQKLLIDYAHVLATAYPKEYKDWGKRTKRLFPANSLASQSASGLSSQRAAAWLAAWPDLIRSKKLGAIFTKLGSTLPLELRAYRNRTSSTWHYENTFFDKHNQPITGCEKKNWGNLYTVLPLLARSLQQAKSVEQQAVLFSFYIHLVGDLHQPLHNIARSDTQCKHDRGGNNHCLRFYKNETKSSKAGKCKLNAHRYWDLAAFVPVQPLEGVSETTEACLKQYSYNEWGAESFRYLTNIYPAEGEYGSESYKLKAQTIAVERLNLATERTTKIIKCYFN